MKAPGPDHSVTVSAFAGRVRIHCGDRQIAASANALELREAGYPPVYYIPRCDVNMAALTKSSKSTHCPYKGDAGYFSIGTGEGALADTVWSYESPFAAVAEIAGYLAFHADRVRIEVA